MQKSDYFLLTIFIYGSVKKPDEKKGEEVESTLAVIKSVSTNQLSLC